MIKRTIYTTIPIYRHWAYIQVIHLCLDVNIKLVNNKATKARWPKHTVWANLISILNQNDEPVSCSHWTHRHKYLINKAEYDLLFAQDSDASCCTEESTSLTFLKQSNLAQASPVSTNANAPPVCLLCGFTGPGNHLFALRRLGPYPVIYLSQWNICERGFGTCPQCRFSITASLMKTLQRITRLEQSSLDARQRRSKNWRCVNGGQSEAQWAWEHLHGYEWAAAAQGGAATPRQTQWLCLWIRVWSVTARHAVHRRVAEKRICRLTRFTFSFFPPRVDLAFDFTPGAVFHLFVLCSHLYNVISLCFNSTTNFLSLQGFP